MPSMPTTKPTFRHTFFTYNVYTYGILLLLPEYAEQKGLAGYVWARPFLGK